MATSMCMRSLRSSVFRNVFGSRNRTLRYYATAENNKAEAEVQETPENAPPPPPQPSEIETKLQDEIKKLEKDNKEMKDKYLRSLAETENVRKRMRKQIEESKQFGIQGFCKDLLEVADVLNKATTSVPKEELSDKNPHLKSLFEGLTMTESQLLKVFEKHGVVQISPKEGDVFDPNFHEALFQVPTQDSESASKIARVEKIGYMLVDRTIRPALVGVFKA